MAQWKSISLQHGRTIDRISLWPNYFFLKLCIYSVIFLQLQTSLQKYFGPTGLKLWSIFLGKTLLMKWNFCLGDLGGYGIAYQPPAGPHFRPRALGRKWGPLGGWSAIRYPPSSPRQKLPIYFKKFERK